MRKGFLVLALLAAAAVIAGLALRRGPAARPAAAVVASGSVALSAPGMDSLVGQWARTDGTYTIEILRAAPDGALEARYFNPRPINVSRAEAMVEAGRLTLFVELRDRLYPGSYYLLAYEPSADVLLGVYHQLGIGERFDVVFERVVGRDPASR